MARKISRFMLMRLAPQVTNIIKIEILYVPLAKNPGWKACLTVYITGASAFSILDMKAGYHPIRMHETDCEKTVFQFERRKCEFTRMPFGLQNAPTNFQRLMNEFLEGLDEGAILIYMDDIIKGSIPNRFVITSDANHVALGAVLAHVDDSGYRPVAFSSRKLTPAESRFSAIERELLGVVWAVEYFRAYVWEQLDRSNYQTDCDPERQRTAADGVGLPRRQDEIRVTEYYWLAMARMVAEELARCRVFARAKYVRNPEETPQMLTPTPNNLYGYSKPIDGLPDSPVYVALDREVFLKANRVARIYRVLFMRMTTWLSMPAWNSDGHFHNSSVYLKYIRMRGTHQQKVKKTLQAKRSWQFTLPPSKIAAPGTPPDEDTRDFSTAATKPAPTATTTISTATASTSGTSFATEHNPLDSSRRMTELSSASAGTGSNPTTARPPPIHVAEVSDFEGLYYALEALVGSDGFTCVRIISRAFFSEVRIEEPYRTRSTVQCTRCQGYQHTKGYRNRPPLWVLCGGGHESSTCLKTREAPATCALCGGDHPANYKGCQVYKELQERSRPGQPRRDASSGRARPVAAVLTPMHVVDAPPKVHQVTGATSLTSPKGNPYSALFYQKNHPQASTRKLYSPTAHLDPIHHYLISNSRLPYYVHSRS
ncbi:hypothetical protein AAG570_008422 [Ranatra chinensis]|uniref:Reverse transcriptase/retrotransposon-derived protein RNase H-like domain-containing protein n=1 Tax=Ranatra chinensis TaxID=642074 RepID=A0ABD0Z7Y5_9HEMI